MDHWGLDGRLLVLDDAAKDFLKDLFPGGSRVRTPVPGSCTPRIITRRTMCADPWSDPAGDTLGSPFLADQTLAASEIGADLPGTETELPTPLPHLRQVRP